MIGLSAVRELVTIFIVERTEQFKQYQFIFGLSREVHTLGNLFYMGAYLSVVILPFYLTLSWFDLAPRYVFCFGAFVISTCTLAMALTAFFRDHKIALELIGMLFSLSSFLIFFYDPASTDKNWVEWIAMVMPNSAFAIAIIHNNTLASLYSLVAVKVYLLVYVMVEYPDYFSEHACKWCKRAARYLPCFRQAPTLLMEEFELNEVVNSEFEQATEARKKEVVIRTEGLVKSYMVNKSLVSALNGVSMQIHKSEIFGLLGRNGAGKTTLVDILTNVTKPSAGSFLIVNNSKTMGICYQHEILYENLTVEEHLHIYSLIKPLDFESQAARKQHIDETIEMLAIEGERNKKMKELSGGNKRKLSIAIAILGRPEILIFD
jgi:ABC-type polysaccharide/polyol phosphate transport system ATPase subunit